MDTRAAFDRFPNLIWGLQQCQSKSLVDVDHCIVCLLRNLWRGLGFYAFLSQIRLPGREPTTRFFSPGRNDEPMLLAALEDALSKLDEQTHPTLDDYRILDVPESGDPVIIKRFGEEVRLHAVAIKAVRPDGVAPLRMAFLGDEKAPAVNAGSSFWVSLAAEIHIALYFRDVMFLHFPRAYSDYLWQSAKKARCNVLAPRSASSGTHKSKLFDNSKLYTVTLSLDLRQSTFAMEKAVSRDVFSRWMDGLVKAYRTLVNDYFGVFDKFTGDGVLAHFLGADDLPGGNPSEAPTRRGVYCAMDMVAVTQVFIDRLQPILRVNSKLFGAGVGIAADYANWSLDGTRNPMIVGHGVVDACRLCSSAKTGEILMTVNAYHRLRRDPAVRDTRAEEVAFVSKNYPQEMELSVWRLHTCGPDFSERYEKILALANRELQDIEALTPYGDDEQG